MPMRVNPESIGGGVPSIFAPTVTMEPMPFVPATAPMVRPMKNSSGSLLQQTGQTLTQAGDTEMKLGNTIGDRVQETMDDASTKAAENQFLQGALPLLDQYKSTEGINATQQFDPTAQAIVKARQDARAALTNPIQQQMFDQVTNAHVLTFNQQMAAHENVQRVQYGKDQAKARADSLNTMSTLDVAGRNRDGSDFNTYGAQSDAEVLHYAALSGVAPDSPQADQMLRQNRTQRYQSVITALLDQHAYNEAGDFFAEHKGEMDVRAAEALGNAVKSATQAEQVTEYRNQAVQSTQKTPGAGPLTAPIPGSTITTTPGVDGIDIHAAPGTNVHAPANGTVSKVWTDEQSGLSAQVTLPNGYVATFSGLGAVNYKEGQKITQGQVLGLSGADDNGRAVTHYAMTDPKGEYIDPRQAVSAPYDPKNFSSPDDEEKAVSWINANVSDPVQQREAEGQVRRLADMNREINSQQHAAAVKQATDYWFQNGQSLNGLPAQLKMQLTPEDMFAFSKKAEESAALSQDWYRLGQEQKTRNEVNLVADWNADPKLQTVDAVRQAYAQGQLSDNTYEEKLREAQKMEADPTRIRQASIDHDQLTDILSLNNWGNLAQPKLPPDKLARVQLETAIKNEIDVQQQQGKRALTWQEKGKIARDMVIDKVYTNNNSTLTPTAILTPQQMDQAHVWVGPQGRQQQVRMADIPAKYAVQARQELRAIGQTPTQANIASWWVKAGRPTQ